MLVDIAMDKLDTRPARINVSFPGFVLSKIDSYLEGEHRGWLARLAKQLVHEMVIDKQFANQAFSSDGGAKILNERLGGKLKLVLDNLADALWPIAA